MEKLRLREGAAMILNRDKRQIGLPGTEPDSAALAKRRAASPLTPTKAQLPCDVGLFSDEADQLDLVEMLQQPVED